MQTVSLLLDSRAMGGIETHVAILAEALKDQGYLPTVSFLKNHGAHPLDDHFAARDIPVMKHTGIWDYIRHIKATRPTIIHTHGYKAGIIGRLGGRHTGLPVISTYHSGDPGRGRVFFYNWLDRKLSHLCTPIAVSQEIAEGLSSKTTVIDNFVATPDWDHVSNGLLSSPKQIAFVGRLSHEKGPDIFCKLAECLPQHDFHIYGDGPMRAALEAQYNAHATFHGMVSDIKTRWKDIGLLVMPSRHEGLPMAALEAMSHGIPVAAFDVGGLPHLIAHEKNGLISPAGDLPDLIASVDKFMEAPDFLRYSMSKQAHHHIKAHYSTEHALEKILSVYKTAKEEICLR